MATREDIYTAIRNADAAGDTASVQKLAAYLQTMDAPQAKQEPKPEQGMLSKAVQFAKDDLASTPKKLGNVAAGLVRGAGSIGATIIAPWDIAKDAIAGKGLSLESNRQRRADMTGGLQELGADPNSIQFQGGKVLGEIAGSMGAGGAVANGVRLIPGAANLATAIGSGGLAANGAGWGTRIAGGAINGLATAGLVDPEQAPTGAVIGGSLPVVAYTAGRAGNALSNIMESGSRRLMQSAIKPTLAQRASGDADTAVQTLLDHGISPTKAGVEKLKALIDAKNVEIADALASSNAMVPKDKVLGRLDDVRSVFRNQVNPTNDLTAIEGVAGDFSAHPAFSRYEAARQQLEDELAKATAGKVSALQAAGKLKTMAAQQQSLAEGRTIGLSAQQPEFQPYYNPGVLGREATSPSSLPVPGFPRIPARYTHNIERVQEGESGAKDAMAIYAAKRLEEANAAKALADLKEQGASMTVQQAQKLKQGTYRVLNGKYGEQGSAAVEAQKGLARGLKEEIATAVPEIQGLNAEESRLIKTLDVAERRALLELNKNPVGLTALASNPLAAVGFMADRSAAFKAIAARMINASAPGATAGALTNSVAKNPLLRNALVRPALLANETSP